MSMALEGIRVIDWTQFTAGPDATRLLGGLGAEVIKIEMPERGDPARGHTTLYGVDMRMPHNLRMTYEYQNRNKKGITLNLESEKGRNILYRLVAKSDVFVTNFLVGRRKQFKVEYKDLRERNPKLIYAVNTIFGSKGPDADMPGWDLLGQAKSGLMMNVGPNVGKSNEIPLQGTQAMSDVISATIFCFSIVTALLARERLGIGQEVEVSQLGSLMSTTMALPIVAYLQSGQLYDPFIRDKVRNPVTTCYKCKDGRWVMMTGTQNKHWPLLCQMIGKTSLAEEARFASLEEREKHKEEIISILDGVFVTKEAKEWEELGRKWGFPLCIVNRTQDLDKDPQVLANDYIVEVDHPLLGKMKYPGYPFLLSETPFTHRSTAPQLGQHTEEVLIELLGYDWQELEKLRDEGVI